MSEITIIITDDEKTRKAEITVADTQTCGDITQAAVDNWAMDKERDYTLVNVSKTPPQILNLSTSLATAGVLAGETLQIRRAIVAGR